MTVKILDKAVFARRLFTLRRKAGMSQSALAKRVGVNTSTVSRWEDAVMLPANEDMETLSEVFGVAPDFWLVEEMAPGGGYVPGSARVIWPSLKRINELLKRIDDEETARLALEALEKVLAASPSENVAAQSQDLSRLPADVLVGLAEATPAQLDAIRAAIRLASEGTAIGKETSKEVLHRRTKGKKLADA